MQSIINRNRILFLHLSFWGVYLSFFLFQLSRFWQDRPVEWDRIITIATTTMVFTMGISYLNYFYFLPRFLQHKNIGRYLLEFSIPFILILTLRLHLERFLTDGYTHEVHFVYSSRFLIQIFSTTLFIVIFVGMLRFAEGWFEIEAKKKEAENEKLTAELNFLKAQINPHFLFNTLNNLYYLAYTQSPNTTEVIEKLSQMMRYMIYDSNHPQVPLRKEIAYMENYISLEKLRLNNQIPIQFCVCGNPEGILIVPLIFITFLENAFKHGVSNNHPHAWINIRIELTGKECTYTVENSKLQVINPVTGDKSGIGLQNVKRRLDLSYPDSYRLKVEDQPNRYAVELKLTLN